MNQAPTDLLMKSNIATLVVDETGTILLFSAGAEALWQQSASDVIGQPLSFLIPEYAGIETTAAFQFQTNRFLHIDDAHGRQHNLRVLLDTQQQDGKILHTLFLYHDPIIDMQSAALDASMQSHAIQEILHRLCCDLEPLIPGSQAILLLVSDKNCLYPIGSATVPAELIKAYSTLDASAHNDLCTTAIYSGINQYADDIARHPRYVHCRQAALSAGLKSCSALPVKNSNGTVMAVLVLLARHHTPYRPNRHPLVRIGLQILQITLEREKTRKHIHDLTFYDSSTGLPNRSMLQSHVSHLLYHHWRSSTPLSLLQIKLHDLGRTAAAHTDESIDNLRQILVQRIQGATRQSDVTGFMAADEISVVLPRCSTQQAVLAAERFLLELRKPVLLAHNPSYQSNISIGVATCPDDSCDFDTLARHASIAMQHVASDGRHSIRVFQSSMDQAVQERLRLENDLRNTLRNNGLHMHYQPQIGSEPETGLLGLEALARWRHPELGDISPVKFIPLAEESDLIDDIAFWTLDHACQQLALWRQRGLPAPRVAVNLSAVNLQNPNLPARVTEILARYKLQPCDLTLEITESAILSPDRTIGFNVAALDELGILLSLDDFGTGYSSLSYLHRLPIRELKLDRSFIADLDHSPTAQILTRSILQLANNLHLHVVAEGVETEKQRDFLRSQCCNALQGYLISRPLPPDELEQWLAQQR